MDNVKILNVQWIYNVGIVTIDNGYEVKTYIKQVRGLNEEEDIQDVIEYGYKIYPEQLKKILSFYGERKVIILDDVSMPSTELKSEQMDKAWNEYKKTLKKRMKKLKKGE